MTTKKRQWAARKSEAACSAQVMGERFKASKPRQCVACGKQAKRIYGWLTHTDAVICSKRCYDAFLAAMTEEPNTGVRVGATSSGATYPEQPCSASE